MKLLLPLLLLLSFATVAQEQEAQQQEEQPSTEQSEQAEGAAEEPAADSSDNPAPIKYDYVSPVELLELQQLDVVDVVDEQDMIWLQSGSDKLLALLSNASTNKRRGVAVMLPDWTETQFSDQGMRYLRKSLNDLGWVTIALLPPKHLAVNGDNLKAVYLPESDEQTENQQQPQTTAAAEPPPSEPQPTEDTEVAEGEADAEQSESAEQPAKNNTIVKYPPPPPRLFKAKQGAESVSEKQMEAYLDSLQKIMEASARQSRRYPGYLMVVAHGTSAAWLNQLYKDRKLGRPHAMVAIESYLPEYKLNQMVPEEMAQSGVPTLDLFSQSDNRWALSTTESRLKASKKYFKLNYRQRELFGSPSSYARHQLMQKEIYGWLVSIGMM